MNRMRKTHHINMTVEVPIPYETRRLSIVRRAVRMALEAEGVAVPCELGVLFTDDAGIQEINRDERQIDEPTDVLSFPMLELRPGRRLKDLRYADPQTGSTYLGDMVLNFSRVQAQAEEFGHGVERELCYLVVHSVLHLLGYDHLDEGEEKARMRKHEEIIMKKLNLSRGRVKSNNTTQKKAQES